MSLWFVDMNQRVKKPGSSCPACEWAASAMCVLLTAPADTPRRGPP